MSEKPESDKPVGRPRKAPPMTKREQRESDKKRLEKMLDFHSDNISTRN